jgi:hypothetical protein
MRSADPRAAADYGMSPSSHRHAVPLGRKLLDIGDLARLRDATQHQKRGHRWPTAIRAQYSEPISRARERAQFAAA